MTPTPRCEYWFAVTVSQISDAKPSTRVQNSAVSIFAGHTRPCPPVIDIVIAACAGSSLWKTTTVIHMPMGTSAAAAIAYVGTYVVGQTARYYYEQGHRPPPEVIASFRTEALRRYNTVNDALKQRLGGDRPALPTGEVSPSADGHAQSA